MSNANNSIRSAVTLPSAIPVLDPMCKAGFIHVPMHLTAPTKGRSDWTEAAGVLMRDLSVCCLFQNNRCRAGTGCRQIHCDRNFIAQERQKQVGVVSCCLACRDSMTLANLESAPATSAFATAVRREASVRFTGAAAVGMPILPIRSFALTSGLQPYVQKAGAVIDVPWTAVCRLHLKDQCKFGRDCKNVHACTLLGKNLLSTAAVTVNQSVSPSILETAAATPLRQPAAASAPPQPPQTPTIVPPRAMSVSAESFFAERQQSWAAANASVESVPTPSAASPAPIAPIADLATFRQPRAPAQFRASFPRLDEGSLQLRDADLDGLIFNLPTLHSALSNDSYACNEFSDLFGLASPAFAGGASPLASLLLGPIGSGAGMIPASSPVSPAQRGCSVRLR